MADYFEEDYSTEYQGDVNEGGFFGNYEEDSEEEVFSRNFDSLSSEERNQRFGNKDFFEVLDELDDELNNSRRFFFMRNKRIVDANEFAGIIDEIHGRTPNEIVEGRRIQNDEAGIISRANDDADRIRIDADNYSDDTRAQADDYSADVHSQADNYYSTRIEEGENEKARIIEDARRVAAQMVSEHQITIDARAEGKRIIEEAKQQGRELVNLTNQSVADYKQRINDWADESLEAVSRYCFDLLVASRKLSDDHIRGIDEQIRQAQSELEGVKRTLGHVQ